MCRIAAAGRRRFRSVIDDTLLRRNPVAQSLWLRFGSDFL
jgi:hypothetical protein